ncbi:MAG: HAD-IB family hydrolase [Citrobacter freundii]|nr:MAG: HAD-IB family hydrolase [Citrobacter freundii]
MKKGIAFFDFDGTITTKDTLLEFIRFAKGTLPFYTGFMLNSPYLVAFKAKIISNQLAKEKILAYFFKGMPLAHFEEICQRFATEVLPGLLRPDALKEIRSLQEKNIEIVIVSASPENWLKQWAQSIGASLIATRLEVKNDRLTGKIEGLNCYGEEKVCRIKALYTLTDYLDIFAYGDSSGDKPMLALANHSSYKPFRKIN